MPAKNICPHCFGKYRVQDFDRHVARHSDPDFHPAINDPATPGELEAAGMSEPTAPTDSPAQRRVEESQIMSSSPQPYSREEAAQDRRIESQDLQIVQLTAALKEAQTAHQPLKTNLAHVANCPSCRSDLEDYNKDLITKAIDSLTPDAIRNLGFEKGAFPSKFVIPGGE